MILKIDTCFKFSLKFGFRSNDNTIHFAQALRISFNSQSNIYEHDFKKCHKVKSKITGQLTAVGTQSVSQYFVEQQHCT